MFSVDPSTSSVQSIFPRTVLKQPEDCSDFQYSHPLCLREGRWAKVKCTMSAQCTNDCSLLVTGACVYTVPCTCTPGCQHLPVPQKFPVPPPPEVPCPTGTPAPSTSRSSLLPRMLYTPEAPPHTYPPPATPQLHT